LDNLLKETTESASENSRQDAIIGATRFGILLAFLHTTLEPLEFSSRTHISQGTVTLLRALMTTRGEQRRFILVPTYEYNYLYSDVMSHILRATRQAFAESTSEMNRDTQSIAVLSYPNIYRENVLANCLLGHEIGHFVVEQSQLVNKVMSQIQLNHDLLQKIIDEAKKAQVGPQSTMTDFLSDEMIRAETTNQLTSVLDSWITELSSDIFAFRILGPVFVFSLTKILLTLQPFDVSSHDHPSARTRLKLLLEQIEQQSFLPDLRKVTGANLTIAAEIVSFFEGLKKETIGASRVPPSSREEVLEVEILDDAIEGIREKMIAEVDRIVVGHGYRTYSATMMVNDIFQLYDCLSSFVPPCERAPGEPGDIVSILNAGMAFMIGGKEEYYTHFQAKDIRKKLEAEEKINQLILKAIELSYLETRLRI